ncbi:MAG: hypothetical protein ACRDQU_14905 [Pseudonocardiaceae bacterium]
MRISEVFAMGGTGGYDNCGNGDYDGFYGDDTTGEGALDDPRSRRHGLREITGTRRYGGSGLSALFTRTRD